MATISLSGVASAAWIAGLCVAGTASSVQAFEINNHREGGDRLEDPYVDADRAAYLVGNRAFQLRAEEAQRKSIVLLQNQNALLPLRAPTANAPVRIYTMGMRADVVGDARWNGFTVVAGDYDVAKGEHRAAGEAGHDESGNSQSECVQCAHGAQSI